VKQQPTDPFTLALSKVLQTSSRDELMQQISHGLVQAFKFDFVAIYKRRGLGNRYTRIHHFSEIEIWGSRSIPDTLTLAGPAAKSLAEWQVSDKHPSSLILDDPFTKGEYLCGEIMSNEWVCYAYSKNGRKQGSALAEAQDVFCKIVQNKWDEISMAGNTVQEAAATYSNSDLKEQLEQLQQANEELRQFAYRASHDLQEPLRTISNYVGLFKRNYGNDLNEEGREYLGFAKDASERMHRLVKDLLEYTKLDHQNGPKMVVDGNKMLEEALENIKMAAEENDAIILYEDMPVLEGHEKQLVSLFQNLINNAIKFKGDGTPMVTIDVNEKDQSWEFSISDNGIGINNDFRDKIFQFFIRLHSTSEYKGSGLGLSICKKIVENHNGVISVNSTEGKGSTFVFDIAR
jgi:signal transduction histidine kinase